ncbi:MAG: hypothetical protein KAH77_01410 [Thiomargarita sp.]|nr:hypothetical protein [Thiomargarita sp.]
MRKHAQRPIKYNLEIPGDIYMIPDTHWEITTSAKDHPGVCITYADEQRKVILSKGTSAHKIPHKYIYAYTIVNPTEKNGLSKSTAFSHITIKIRWHKVKLYYPERHIGRFEQNNLAKLRNAQTIKQEIQNAIQKKSLNDSHS